jgi:predicted RNA methylase
MIEFNVESRSLQSAGTSAPPVHEAVIAMLTERNIHAHTVLDLGCGTGGLRDRAKTCCDI